LASISNILDNYELPATLGFGQELAPVMYRADFSDGQWQDGELVPFGPVAINPAATALQFAQQAFEGMKAFRIAQCSPQLFRPEMNFQRLGRSAERLCMPAPSAELFADSLTQLSSILEAFIPGGNGQSLYLRPTLFGLDPKFAVQGSANFTFLCLASPSDAYYGQPITVMIERENCRASVGGTGAEKVGCNYAASLQATQRSIESGFDQPLWLDPAERKSIEELSGMNFMAVIDGDLHTPVLNGSILPGVTRDSLIRLATSLGVDVFRRNMPVDDLLSDIKSGRCSEVFACGTGAIVCPISAIGEADGSILKLSHVDEMANRLKLALLDIQEGRAADQFKWMVNATQSPDVLNRLVDLKRDNQSV